MAAELRVQPIPYREPVSAFGAFRNDPVAIFFDSADTSGGRARYSYIAADPYKVISATEKAESGESPFDTLRREMSGIKISRRADLPPFQTGAAGVFSYELGRHLEKLPPPLINGLCFPEMFVGLYDTVAAFDTHEKTAWVIASDVAGGARPSSAERAKIMAARIKAAPELAKVDLRALGSWRVEMSRPAYETAVERIIEYIHAGDILQANLTQRFVAEWPDGLHPFDLYRRLRALSAAPFAAYLACGEERAVVSASPECFLSLDAGGHVMTRPIKGTRRRGANVREDRELAAELLASEKDQAENLMIVDLLRNDLSKVCELGSVRTAEIASLETFANVHHLVSTVRGKLRHGLGAIDLLEAAFPGGSVTGAPKIRAMEIIFELEPARRGPYCGAIAWMGFDGVMDSSVVIRTLTLAEGKIVAQAGGGIVADSDPANEYDEAITKARALLDSVGPAEFEA